MMRHRVPELIPAEREALHRVWNTWTVERQPGGPINVAKLVLALLDAAPSLREIEGMALDTSIRSIAPKSFYVKGPDGRFHEATDWDHAVRFAQNMNHTVGPGHQAVRLAVVEVAATTGEKDGG